MVAKSKSVVKSSKDEVAASKNKSAVSAKKAEVKKESKAKSVSADKKKDAVSTAGKIKAKAGAAKDLSDLYEDGLKDIYWAEKALKKSLPKMEKNATSAELKKAIATHLKETEEHISRLEKCFDEIGVKAKGEKCDAMAGLLEEAKGLMEEAEIGAVRDVAIIAAAQKVEHYEIATYGTLAAFAKVLGHKKGIKHLVKTLDEEKACDELLSSLADTTLNSKAEG